MDIRTMQYFLAIAQEGSFTKAAERLHMTQPPLSRQMRDLEAELGVALFARGGKGVTLTEEGARFKERAQEVVDLMGQIESDMASEASNILGEVRIACGESDAVAFLAKAAKGLQRSHPGVTYRLLSGDGGLRCRQARSRRGRHRAFGDIEHRQRGLWLHESTCEGHLGGAHGRGCRLGEVGSRDAR